MPQKQVAAVHEAGHLVAARHCGVAGWARIWRELGKLDWCGDFTCHATPQTRYARTLVGLAGACAVALFEDPAVSVDQVVLGLRVDRLSLSSSDALLFGSKATELEIELVLEVLRSRWCEIEHEATRLMEYGRAMA